MEITPELVKLICELRAAGASAVKIGALEVQFAPQMPQALRPDLALPGSNVWNTVTSGHYGTIQSEAEKYMLDALRSAGS